MPFFFDQIQTTEWKTRYRIEIEIREDGKVLNEFA